MAIMSQRAYARQRGVSVSTVRKAFETGRISTLPTGQIDSDVADEEWTRNTQTHAPHHTVGDLARRRAGTCYKGL
jgi:hypothetical protein